MDSQFKLKQEMQVIAEKLSDIEAEMEEYNVVIEALKPLEGERKCHRLINGVLIERTVSQVLPALTLNFDNMKKLHSGLISTYKKHEEEIHRSQKNF